MSLAVREEMRDCSRRVCDQSEQIHMAASLEPCPGPPPIEADDALLLPTGERRLRLLASVIDKSASAEFMIEVRLHLLGTDDI